MAGGAELMVAWLSEGLAARGHRVTVVSTCGPEMQPYPVEVRNGVTVIRFFPRNMYWNFARQSEPPRRRALWHLRDAWNTDAGRRFAAILREAPPDIVHTHLLDGFSATIWRRARKAGIPIVHTAHDYHLLCPRAFLLTRDWRTCEHPKLCCRAYRAWHLHTAADVDLFVSPSEFLLQRHRAAGLNARRTAVVRNGIPLPDHATLMRRERSADRMRFLLLARLTPEKGVRTVLQAVASLPSEVQFRTGCRRARPVGRRRAAGCRGRSAYSIYRLCHRRGEGGPVGLCASSYHSVALVRECACLGDRSSRVRTRCHRQPDWRLAGAGSRRSNRTVVSAWRCVRIGCDDGGTDPRRNSTSGAGTRIARFDRCAQRRSHGRRVPWPLRSAAGPPRGW